MFIRIYDNLWIGFLILLCGCGEAPLAERPVDQVNLTVTGDVSYVEGIWVKEITIDGVEYLTFEDGKGIFVIEKSK